jgi:hypothetical protein
MTAYLDETGIPMSNWFSTTIEYEGWGRAEFADPLGVIEGPVTIQFDQQGEYPITYSDTNITMRVEKIAPERTGRGRLEKFFRRRLFQDSDEDSLSGADLTYNRCTNFTVTTTDGVFTLGGEIHYTYSEKYNFERDEVTEERLYFASLQSYFDASNAGPAKSWVLPLVNFISRLVHQTPPLDQHPLRIYPTPPPPEGVVETQEQEAQRNRHNRLIIFDFNGGLGFIEALPDFVKRSRQLKNEEIRRAITAVMVGEVGGYSISDTDLKSWFPFDFLPLLSVATGIEVGAPWYEFRDANGNLVRRVHYALGKPTFAQGHAAINEMLDRSTGDLITRFAISPGYGQTLWRVVMKNMVNGVSGDRVLEDSLGRMFVALDALSESYKTKSWRPMKKIAKARQAEVKNTIKTAADALTVLADQAEHEEQKEEAEILRKISRKVEEATNLSKSYGDGVVELLKQFGLHDAEAIERHYAQHPRHDKRTWSAMLSKYRGTTQHRSYFDFSEGGDDPEIPDMDDVGRLLYHLHDVLIRILLKMIGYTGTYQAATITMRSSVDVNWVKPDTHVSNLGY